MFKITIVGNLGRDAELKNANGQDVLNFSVGVRTGYGQKESTAWVNCGLWGKRGQALAQYLTKGQQVVVDGLFSERHYQDNNGQQRTALECNVSEIALVGGKSEGNGQQQYQQPAQQHQQQYQQPAQQHQQQYQQPQQPQGQQSAYDDDVPF